MSEKLVLVPLAWDHSDNTNGPVLLGMSHTTKPFWGIQFHPESICSTPISSERLMANWWVEAKAWLASRGRRLVQETPSLTSRPLSVSVISGTNGKPSIGTSDDRKASEGSVPYPGRDRLPHWRVQRTAHLNPITLSESLRTVGRDHILLDSQGHNRGRYDILGFVDKVHSTRLKYSVSSQLMAYGTGDDPSQYTAQAVDSS